MTVDLPLSPIGEKIYLDRYALKDPQRQLVVGDLVVVQTDPKTGQREIGNVIELLERDTVRVQLRSGEVVERGREHVDKPLETDPAQCIGRVAEGASRAERPELRDRWRGNFEQLLNGWKFVPGGRILTGLGTEQHLTYFNCFVLPCPEDSLQGIFDTQARMAKIMSRGGGVGINISSLRPRYAYVRGVNGRTSGSVSWGGLYSYVTGLIEQGGSRRGALMLILNVWHPDVLDFISSKRTAGQITNANISVGITDAFMEAVEKDEAWILRFPDTNHPRYNELWNGDLETWENMGLPVVPAKSVPARVLWRQIIESAHASAEPGVWFVDRAKRESNSWYYPEGNLICTNPCVTGDTLIATVEEGVRPISELAGRDVKVWSWDPTSKQPVVRWMRRVHRTRSGVPVIEVEFDSGLKLKCTPDHGLYTFRGRKVAAQDLRIGQSVRAFAVSRHKDGQLRAHAGSGVPLYAHRLVWEEAHGAVPEGLVVHHEDENPENNRLQNLSLLTAEEHNRRHHAARKANGFDGWKPGEMSAETKAKISAGNKRFHREKQEVGNHKVVAIREAGYADVFNGMVEGSHTYVICDPAYRGTSGIGLFSGIVSANCGEQCLPAWAVCNLGHVNLAPFVLHPFERSARVNWADLSTTIRWAVRFLDNVIDVTPYFFDENQRQQQLERRVGLGTLGLAEMLIKLGIRYGDAQCVAWLDKFYARFAAEAYLASTELAEEKGCFPAYDHKMLQSGFMKRLLAYADQEEDFHVLRRRLQTFGCRNVTLLTQAPTGTVGTMVGTSTGIEPFYSWSYTRKSRLGSHREEVEVVEQFRAHVGADADFRLPDFFVNAMELAPEEHVQVQAVIQQWVDSSISKTSNVPASYTVDQVAEIYRLYHQTGCKGGTIYRDKSRDEQVLMQDEAEPVKAPVLLDVTLLPALRPLPHKRYGVTLSKSTPLGTAHFTANSDEDGNPLEVFMEIGKGGSDTKAMAEALGRLVSLMLRAQVHMTPRQRVEHVVQQLRGIGGASSVGFGRDRVSSLPDALAAAMEEVFLGGPAVSTPEVLEAQDDPSQGRHADDLCPSCGNSSLRKQEGCEHCAGCGYSRC